MAKDKNNNRKSFFSKLRDKYRLVVLNEDTYEQKASLRLSMLNLFIAVALFIFVNIMIVTLVIAYTPLKYMMPGVGALDVRSKLLKVEMLVDSLEYNIEKRNMWLNDIQHALTGDFDSSFSYTDTFKTIEEEVNIELPNEIEQEFREELKEEISLLSLETGTSLNNPNYLPLKLLAPVEGVLISFFDSDEAHYGVDISTKDSEPVKASEEGVVIVSDWNPDTGYVIAIQHRNDAITFYKHNDKLLKKVGNFVHRGEAIAIAGNSGELTDGPHLHFELWQNGKAVNPEERINFKKINN